MKKLTKTLSLVLVIAMIVSLCVVGVSAKTFSKDGDKITKDYAEAVDVMSGVGIIEGTDAAGTTFNPTGNFTRAAAAKIIAYMQLGVTAASALKGTASTFKDVPSTNWAAPYIAYCAQMKIINGYGNGNFGPDDALTGYAWAKMLLSAVGYGAKGEYTGSSWSINVAKDALTKGVFTNVLSASTPEVITREQATQMAFNTLTGIDKVTYSTLVNDYIAGGAISGVTTNGTLGEAVYKLYKTDDVTFTSVTAQTAAKDGSVNMPAGTSVKYIEAPTAVTSMVTKAALTFPLDMSMVGRTGYTYVVVDKSAAAGYKVVASVYYDDTLVATKTDGKGFNAAAAKTWTNPTYTNTNYVGTLDAAVVYYINGAPATDVQAAAAAKIGAVVKFYNADTDAAIDVVTINTYTVAPITAVTTGTDATTGAKTYTTTPAVVAAKTSEKLISGAENLVKGNVVLYYTFGGVTYVTKADSFTGNMSAYNTAAETMTIDSKDSTRSGLTSQTFAQMSAFAGKAGTTFYTDANAYVVYVTNSAALPTNYAFIKDFGMTSTVGDAAYAAQLVFADGTVSVVSVNKVYATVDATTAISSLADYTNDVCLYVKNDNGSYNLYLVTTTAKTSGSYQYQAAAYGEGATMVTGAMSKGVSAYTSGRLATEDTVFVVYNTDTAAYTVCKGISNMIKTGAGKTASYNAIAVGNNAAPVYDAFVYMTVSNADLDTSAQASTYAFIYDTDCTAVMKADGSAVAYYSYPAIVDGKTTTQNVAAKALVPSVGLYKITGTTSGVASAMSLETAKATGAGVTNVGGTVVIGGTSYTFASDAVIYTIDATAGTATSTDKTALDGNTTYSSIYVVNPASTVANYTTTISALYLVG